MENNKLLKIENLKMHIKTYMGTVKAVDGVNIDIDTGKVNNYFEGFDMPEADGAMILSASSSKRQRIQRMGRVLRITANKQNALIVTVYSSKTEYEKLREESNRYQLEGVPVKWQQMK